MTTPKTPIYLDYAATTPVDPRVAEVMWRYLTTDGNFANPASRSHMFGWQAEAAVENARKQVADTIGADPREIVWTSGATEADNLALKGSVPEPAGAHLVTSSIEHKAVIDTCRWLEEQGAEVTWLKPDAGGRITVSQVETALRPETRLVSLMLVNNELGTVNDIAAIGDLLRSRGILFHVDAAQAIGKLPVDVGRLKADFVAMSAHKVYGPKGIGALYVRRSPDVSLHAQIHGGGHERGMRSGTLPTHQIVGMGEAFEIAAAGLQDEMRQLEDLRSALTAGLEPIEGVSVNGDQVHRIPGIVSLAFSGVDAESLMLGLRDLALSSGSACASATMEPSYVLKGIGLADDIAHGSLRFSFGRFTTVDEIRFATDRIAEVVPKLRERSGAMA